MSMMDSAVLVFVVIAMIAVVVTLILTKIICEKCPLCSSRLTFTDYHYDLNVPRGRSRVIIRCLKCANGSRKYTSEEEK